jgi:hypothetical protein
LPGSDSPLTRYGARSTNALFVRNNRTIWRKASQVLANLGGQDMLFFQQGSAIARPRKWQDIAISGRLIRLTALSDLVGNVALLL